MNNLSVILFATTLGGVNSMGQTNPPAPRQWFSLSPPPLRLLVQPSDNSNSIARVGKPPVSFSSRENQAFPELQAAGAPSPKSIAEGSRARRLPEQLTLATHPGEFDFRAYRMIEENGYLKRPASKPDKIFVRAVTEIFEPSPFRIGKTTVACSIVTALKKKNPLCLLNPIVLNVSW